MLAGSAPLALFYVLAAALTVALWIIAVSSGVSAGARVVAATLLKLLLLAYVLLGAAILLLGIWIVTGHYSREGTGFLLGVLMLPFALVNFVPGLFLLAKSPSPWTVAHPG